MDIDLLLHFSSRVLVRLVYSTRRIFSKLYRNIPEISQVMTVDQTTNSLARLQELIHRETAASWVVSAAVDNVLNSMLV